MCSLSLAVSVSLYSEYVVQNVPMSLTSHSLPILYSTHYLYLAESVDSVLE